MDQQTQSCNAKLWGRLWFLFFILLDHKDSALKNYQIKAVSREYSCVEKYLIKLLLITSCIPTKHSWCNILSWMAMCFSLWLYFALNDNTFLSEWQYVSLWGNILLEICFCVWQYFDLNGNMFLYVTIFCPQWQYVFICEAIFYSEWQYVSLCDNILPWVAILSSMWHYFALNGN